MTRTGRTKLIVSPGITKPDRFGSPNCSSPASRLGLKGARVKPGLVSPVLEERFGKQKFGWRVCRPPFEHWRD